MDTVEQVNGYYFDGMANISAGELLFWVFVDETMKQLDVSDIMAVVCIVGGLPLIKTRTKPGNATKGTSFFSKHLREIIKVELSPRWPTLTNGSIKRLKFAYVTNLGAFVGRWLPWLGWCIMAYDVIQITRKSVSRYNLIAKQEDRL